MIEKGAQRVTHVPGVFNPEHSLLVTILPNSRRLPQGEAGSRAVGVSRK